jgi:hypothetical protein
MQFVVNRVAGSSNCTGVYEFHCFYHEAIGMIGYLTVLPNSSYTNPSQAPDPMPMPM